MNSNVINSNDLNTYLEVCFSDLEGLVPCRSFPEKGNSANKSAANRWVRVDSKMPLKISSFAKSCASFQSGCYVIPGVVDKSGHSRLHVYWQLAKPAMQDDLSKLLELRYKIALATGQEFLGLKPPRPLKIFYLQSEIGYHYLRERLQNMRLSPELKSAAQDNLLITSNIKLLLDSGGVELLADHIINSCNHIPDIIAVDPIRNVFDGGKVVNVDFLLEKTVYRNFQ